MGQNSTESALYSVSNRAMQFGTFSDVMDVTTDDGDATTALSVSVTSVEATGISVELSTDEVKFLITCHCWQSGVGIYLLVAKERVSMFVIIPGGVSDVWHQPGKVTGHEYCSTMGNWTTASSPSG